MEIQVQLILATCIVHSKWTSVQPHNQKADQFQNLFNSIVKNDLEKSEMQLKILKQRVARQGQAFHAMKQELKTHQNLNSNKNVAWTMTKRETNDNRSRKAVVSFETGQFAFDPSLLEHFNSSSDVCSCYMACGGKFLLLKRIDRGPADKKWCLPGGSKEEDETPLQAILREVEEETGIILDVAKYTRTLYMRFFKPKRDFLLHLYKVTLPKPNTSDYTIKLDWEHSEYVWADLQTAKKLDLMPGGQKILEFLSKVDNRTDLLHCLDEQVYIFPDIQDGDALQPTLKLLLSQKKYHKQLAILFEEMWERNKKSPSHGLLGHSIGDSVMVTGALIDRNIEGVRGYIQNGTADEDFKKEPMDDESAGSLLESWKFLLEYTSTSDLRDHGLNVVEEVEEMQKILLLARREMEVYDNYLDKLYEDTSRTRMARPDNKHFNPNSTFEK